MSDAVARRKAIVANPNGLHARPADLFARLASRFESAVAVIKDGQRVDGKSILDLLTLVAVRGTPLTIVARGSDAHDAVEALARLIELENPLEEMADEIENNQIGSA